MSDPVTDTPIDRAAPRPPRYLISRAAVLLIAATWLVTGVSKVYGLPEFLELIEQHSVIPPDYRWLGLVLPFAELLMALLLVFTAGSELRKPFGRAVLGVSLAAILGFAWYLSRVPDAVIQESGCGCLGPRIWEGMPGGERLWAGVRTGVLVVLHVVALVGPVVGGRRRPVADAPG